MRKFIYLSSAVLFFLTAVFLIITATGEKQSMMIGLMGAAIPFIFVSYWNFFTFFLEKRTGSDNSYFTYGNSGAGGIGLSYNKITVVPFFLVLFLSVSMAIITFILAANRSTEDISIGLLITSFIVSFVITIIFTKRINRTFSALNTLTGENDNVPEKSNDDIGFKIAFFFASLATLGLFPIVYYLVKKFKANKEKLIEKSQILKVE